MTTIAVVIPAYNEAGVIEACLQSVLAQTRQPDEIIVVNNNSTDATARIARQYGARIVAEPLQGIACAAYTGYQHATSDLIARCDADSILPPDWLQKIDRAMSARPDSAGITGPAGFYDTNWILDRFARGWYMYAYFGLVGLAIARWPLFGSNCAFRRTAWLNAAPTVHRSRTDIHDDIDLSLHLPITAPVLFMPSLTVKISARSLRPKNLPQRYARGLRSLYIHWPSQAPWKRWRSRLANVSRREP